MVQCNKYTQLPESQCVDIIGRIQHEVFTAGALEAQVCTTAFRAPAVKTELCTVDYVNTLRQFCICYTPNLKYPLITV